MILSLALFAALLIAPLVGLAQESSLTRPPFVEARWIELW